MRASTLITLFFAGIVAFAAEPAGLIEAVRQGNPAAVKNALRKGADKDAPDPDGLTPLMRAVINAGVPGMRTILDAGANVNAATPEGVTALHIAAFDLPKTRLLLERGGNVNAATKAGETPLVIAADRPGNAELVALLLTKGADPSAKPTNGFTSLMRAATNGDVSLLRLLLANGAKVADNPDLARSAAFGHCFECMEIALAQGASPNGAFRRRSALQDAAAFGSVEMVRLLVEKGADVQAADSRGYTALMRAAISYEPGAAKVVEYLLAKGADTRPKNETGDTALSFALRFGETPIVAMLRAAGAPEAKTAIRVPPPLAENTVRDAVLRSLPLLQRIGEPVFKFQKCISCHNNSLPALAVAMARTRALPVDAAAARTEYENGVNAAASRARSNLMGTGVPDIHPFPLIGLAAERPQPNPTLDLLVHHVSTRQEPNGRFRGQDYRPPQEYTDITFTATAMRAMQLHVLPGRAAEFRDRVRRASRWLAAQTPRDTEEHALRLLALTWSGANKSTRDAAVKELLGLQRADGGWAQTPGLYTDAYATGQSLYALHLAGVPATHTAYQKGVKYLLQSQRKDGSWHVTSRSHPVQPLIDAGHPYFNHQWISAAAGAWSTMALIASMPIQR